MHSRSTGFSKHCCFPGQVGESGWTAPLPLESNAGAEGPDDINTKPVLIRARIPVWGTVHEIVARLELVGGGFERTLVGSCTNITSKIHGILQVFAYILTGFLHFVRE